MEKERGLLDNILLAEAVRDAWLLLCKSIEPLLAGIPPGEIPDEQARLSRAGELEIFVELPSGKGEVVLEVTKAQWAYKQ